MGFFAKTFNDFILITIFTKSFILDVWQRPKYALENVSLTTISITVGFSIPSADEFQDDGYPVSVIGLSDWISLSGVNVKIGIQSKTVLFSYNLQTYNWGQNCLCLISHCWRTLLLSLTCYLFSLKILQTLFEALQIDSKNLLGPGDHSLSACTKYAHVSVRIRG